MLSAEDVMQLVQSLIWLLAGVGVFIVGMNFMSDALEKSAGEGMKKLLGRISNNRFSGVGIGVSCAGEVILKLAVHTVLILVYLGTAAFLLRGRYSKALTA